MKKLLIASFALLTLSLNAQITVPKASPAGKIEQRVGLADLSITYNRPAKRERVVFGDVVPLNETWRTGANENTKFTTSDAIVFGTDTLKAGTYALYTKPTENPSLCANWYNAINYNSDLSFSSVCPKLSFYSCLFFITLSSDNVLKN